MNQSQRRQYLIQALLAERPEYDGWGVPQDAGEQKRLLRGLLYREVPYQHGLTLTIHSGAVLHGRG